MGQAGWYPDPAGRYPQRFFDGEAWNERVRDSSGLSFDPPPDAPSPSGPALTEPPPAPIVDAPKESQTAAVGAGAAGTLLSGVPKSGLIAAAAVAVFVALVGTVGTAAVRGATTPKTQLVTGQFSVQPSATVLTNIYDNTGYGADSTFDALSDLAGGKTFDCSRLYGGYSDIGAGTQVRVSDASGTVLAATSLEGGTLEFQSGCTFTFSVEVPLVDMYRFEVSHRGELVYSRADLEAAGWTVAITL